MIHAVNNLAAITLPLQQSPTQSPVSRNQAAPATLAPQDQVAPQASRGSIPATGVLSASTPPQFSQSAEYLPGELIISYKPGVHPESQMKAQGDQLGLQVMKKLRTPAPAGKLSVATSLQNIYRMKFNPSIPMDKVLDQLKNDPNIFYAEPNYVVRIASDAKPIQTRSQPLPANQVLPNDMDSRLWGLHNNGQNGGTANADIHTAEAWAIQTGKREGGPVIGVIDTGIDYTHPDLAGNIWTNPGEIAGDGIDNDNNGYIDDIHGWDFANDDNDPMDGHGHGTHVAGTIAAKGNDGKGIVGVNWNAQVMGIKFLTDSGSGSTADAIESVMYANAMGVDMTNNSWGGGGFSNALRDAIAGASLFLAAAGNDGTNNDARPHYPSNYQLPNVVSVAASDRNDGKASFSNYGKATVHLAAPGKDIYSTIPGNAYDTYSGTSMATPHVAGVAGLIKSQYPNATTSQIKDRLMNGVDSVPAFANNTISGGRMNAYNSLENDNVAPDAVANLRVTSSDFKSLDFNWVASGDDYLSGKASRYDIRYSDQPISDSNWAQAKVVTGPVPGVSGSAESFTLTGLNPTNNAKTYYLGVKAIDNVGNTSRLATASGQTSPARIIFKDDAQSDNGNIIAQTPWARSGGANKVWTESPNGDYANDMNTSITTKRIDLRGRSTASLSFQHKYDLEAKYDFAYLETSNNGGKDWNTIKTYNGTKGLHTETVGLDQYAGQELMVRFRIKTDASVGQNGWEVDNIIVSADQLVAEQ